MYGKEIAKVLVSREAIAKRVKELAAEINRDYEGKPLLVVCILRGATIFFRQIGGDSRQAATVSAQLGIKSVDINPLSYEWKSEMQRIADGIAQ